MIQKILFVLLLPLYLLAQEHLYITEVMAPPETDATQAFVEIYNSGDEAVSLSDYYLSNYKTYYRLVEDVFSNQSGEFLVRFPDVEIMSGQVVVIALNGTEFNNHFYKKPDFEVKSTDDSIEDMIPLWVGNNPKFEFTRGMIIAFQWDGQTDLVQDIDYMPWGLLPFNSWWMDKSGVSIDGPDDGSETSAYRNDLSPARQKAPNAPGADLSLQRNGLLETAEIGTGGNGIDGHNEATEDWTISFISKAPTPGSFSKNPGDGAGKAVIDPDSIETGTVNSFTIILNGTDDYTLTDIQLTIPSGWMWSQSSADVTVTGSGASGAVLSVEGDVLSLKQARMTGSQIITVQISNITAPVKGGIYPFDVQTAVAGGKLSQIARLPLVYVEQILTIGEILNNFDDYNGQVVTIKPVVAIGSGITRTDRTDAYVQDQSGRGINISSFETNLPDLTRGNLIRITGEVSEYNGDPQIQNFVTEVISANNDIPAVRFVNITSLANPAIKGTMVECAGLVTNRYTFTDGNSNITITDPTGNVVIRVWQTTGIDVSGIYVGDTLGVKAIVGEFDNSPQLLVGYQQDLYPGSIVVLPGGSGEVTALPDSVGLSETTSLTFSFSATSDDTVSSVSISVPSYWGWSGSDGDVSLGGSFMDGTTEVNNHEVKVTGVKLLPGFEGEVTLYNLYTPDVDTASTFLAQTASAEGFLTPVINSPTVLVGRGTQVETIPIAEARLLPVGREVTLKAVVVIGSGVLRSTNTSAYIQDNSGRGINVYKSSLDADIARGNLILIKGILEEYKNSYDDVILEITDYSVRILKTNSAMPDPLQVSPYAAANLDTEYEGAYIEVEGQVKDVTTDDYGSNLTIGDNSGVVLARINIDTGIDLSDIALNDYIIVRGIVGFYRGDVQVTPGYQDQIESYEPGSRPEKDLISLTLPHKPFVPERGEKLKIDYTIKNQNSYVSIRIYDLGGRSVFTLFDGIPYDIELTWNGRNHIGELVPVGAYICHMEVIDNDTGNRQVEMAPIVVGTILSR